MRVSYSTVPRKGEPPLYLSRELVSVFIHPDTGDLWGVYLSSTYMSRDRAPMFLNLTSVQAEYDDFRLTV